MRSRSKANIPIHRESPFWILSPVSCLLPHPPIQPILPSPTFFCSFLCAFASSWLYPNYAKQTQTPKPKNKRNLFYRNGLQTKSIPPRPQKTNPNKPNCVAAKSDPSIRYPLLAIHNKPNFPAPRPTQPSRSKRVIGMRSQYLVQCIVFRN